VWQVTAFRFSLIITVGILLFEFLLYTIGYNESRHLKVRRNITAKIRKESNARIVWIYLLVLCLIISLCFLIIKYVSFQNFEYLHWLR
jgi:hypothetical protein